MRWHSSAEGLCVVVLAGGDSPERAVSLASGANVTRALREAGHHVRQLDPSLGALDAAQFDGVDACFIALHGGAGEDGRIAAQLERLNVPYTGSGPAAARLAMSKSASKERFFQAGVSTLPYVLFHGTDGFDEVSAKVDSLGWPVVVKPDAQGSSLGVSLAADNAELAVAVEEARRFDSFIIAERLAVGREFTVAVLNRQALPLLEIRTPAAFFDYKAKYHAATTQYEFDAGLSASVTSSLESLAVAAADCLDTRGMVRVDMILDACGRPWILEVNTVPGMTQHSLVPMAAARVGMDMATLCDRLIRECLTTEVVS